jgi:hypothetical protein
MTALKIRPGGTLFRPHSQVPATCLKCGICCHMDIPLEDHEVSSFKKPGLWRQTVLRKVIPFYPGPCEYFDTMTRLCRIYDKRPEACRNCERGGEVCTRALSHILILAVVEKELLAATPVFC